MNTKIAIVVTIILATAPLSSVAAPRNPSAAAKALDAQSRKSLGVSIRALAFVFDTGPRSYLDKTSLIKEGSWPRVEELEQAGYVTVTVVPSGQGDLVNLRLTDAGVAVRQALAPGR